jgi:O-antigen ligase
MKNNVYNKIIPLSIIALIPVGLLISSGASELLSILIVLFFTIYLIFKKKYSIFNNIYFKLLLIFWIYLIINHLFSEKYNTDELSLRSFGFIKYILLIFSLKYYFEKNKDFELVLLFWSLIVAIVSFDIFYETLNHQNILGFKSTDPARIASFLRKELKIGHFVLGFSFLVTAYLFNKFKNKSKLILVFCYLFLAITILAIYLTGERSNSIRGLFCLLLFILFGNSKILRHKYLFLTLIIASLIIIFSFSQKLQNRFGGQILQPIKKNGIIKTFKDSQYGAHYNTAINIFKSYPIIGVGNKNFRFECEKNIYFDQDFKWSNQRCATHPHQIYLELISEHGLIGTSIILYIIFFVLYKNIIIYKKQKNLIHLSSILFVIQTFLPFIPSGSFFVSWTATVFWINFAIMLKFSILNNRKIKKN